MLSRSTMKQSVKAHRVSSKVYQIHRTNLDAAPAVDCMKRGNAYYKGTRSISRKGIKKTEAYYPE